MHKDMRATLPSYDARVRYDRKHALVDSEQ